MSAATPDSSESRRRAAFRDGRRAILPYLPGSCAWGLISGVAMVKGGLGVPWAIAMSLMVNAASAQLAALPLIVAGAPLWVIIGTGFITNLRFVIYSADFQSMNRLVGFLTENCCGGQSCQGEQHETPARARRSA